MRSHRRSRAVTGCSTQSKGGLSLGGDKSQLGHLEDDSLDPKSIGKALRSFKRVTKSDVYLNDH